MVDRVDASPREAVRASNGQGAEAGVTLLVWPGDHVQVDEDVRIIVGGVRGGRVQIGVEAPRELCVLRGEVSEQSSSKLRVRRRLRALQEPATDGAPRIRFKRRKTLQV